MTVTRDERAGQDRQGRPHHAVPPGAWWTGRERWLVRGLYLLALIPLGLVAAQAVWAPRQHVLLDYWHVLATITNDDGSLILGQVFSYHLEQPFVVPSLIFWVDARFLGGDNRVLTLLAVVLVAAVVVMLRLMLPAGLSPVKKAALTVGFAFVNVVAVISQAHGATARQGTVDGLTSDTASGHQTAGQSGHRQRPSIATRWTQRCRAVQSQLLVHGKRRRDRTAVGGRGARPGLAVAAGLPGYPYLTRARIGS